MALARDSTCCTSVSAGTPWLSVLVRSLMPAWKASKRAAWAWPAWASTNSDGPCDGRASRSPELIWSCKSPSPAAWACRRAISASTDPWLLTRALIADPPGSLDDVHDRIHRLLRDAEELRTRFDQPLELQ